MGRIGWRASRRNQPGRLARVSAKGLLLWLALSSGCYHYRAQAPDIAGAPATEYSGEVVWSLVWGLVQENPRIDNCNNQPLAEVRVTTNFGFALLTVVTLGLAAPAKVEWRCAKPAVTPGVIRPPADSAGRK